MNLSLHLHLRGSKEEEEEEKKEEASLVFSRRDDAE